ncbi:MAG: glycosyltransferase [Planctomycetota bacterium]|nr:glycosyltransferase [Planctomycetota bacterium]
MDEQELELFPNCVRWLKAASETVGPLELVVADFQSDDWPLDEWLHQEATATFQIRVVTADGPFSRGRGLNIAARHATASRLFFCDADILVGPDSLLRGLAALKAGKAAFPICLYVNHDGAPAFWQSFGAGLAFVDKGVWEAVNGIPEFTSWGGEDDLFRLAVLRQVEERRECDSGLRHQWHPDACRHEHYVHAAQSDFRSTIETGISEARQTESQHTETVKVFRGEHACWVGDVREVHLHASGRMERPGIDFGAYELCEGEHLVLKWDHWPAEILTWDKSSRVYRDRSKSFTLWEVPEAVRIQNK